MLRWIPAAAAASFVLAGAAPAAAQVGWGAPFQVSVPADGSRNVVAPDVAANAAGAAFGDPRLPPVTWSDYEVMTVKVSVLGPLTPVPVRSADELHRTVRPHRDGLLITDGRRRATFLPSVWD